MQSGVINPNEGVGYLQQFGVRANQNFTISPSLTAPGHIAIATGDIASANDINANFEEELCLRKVRKRSIDSDGSSPLAIAVETFSGEGESLIKMLLAAKADPNATYFHSRFYLAQSENENHRL